MSTASICIRLSKAANERNTSLQGMLDDCRELARREGLLVVAEHVDDGVSGAIRNRPGFRAWLNDAAEGRADVLLTYHADRLTREGINVAGLVLDTVEGKDPWTGAEVRQPVRFMDTKGLDSENGDAFRIMFAFASEAARSERLASKRRNTDTQRRLREAGRFAGGNVPYGTRVEVRVVEGREGRYLATEPAEAERLRTLAARIIRGDSVRATVTFANAQGWTTRKGLQWSRTSLRHSLLSDPSRRYVFDAGTYRALQEALTFKGRPQDRPKGGRPSTSLLRGLLVCPCGSKLTTHPLVRGGKRYARYTCMSVSTATACEAPVSVAGDALDQWVTGAFLRRWGFFEHLEPRVILSGDEDLRIAEDAHARAQAALLAEPTAENLAAFAAAQEQVQSARSLPRTREQILVSSGKTMRQVWGESQIPERTALLADLLDGPILVRPARDWPTARGGSRGGAQLNPGRIVLTWRGDNAEYAG